MNRIYATPEAKYRSGLFTRSDTDAAIANGETTAEDTYDILAVDDDVYEVVRRSDDRRVGVVYELHGWRSAHTTADDQNPYDVPIRLGVLRSKNGAENLWKATATLVAFVDRLETYTGDTKDLPSVPLGEYLAHARRRNES